MNNDQIFNKAVDDVWELVRGAWFNYFYHSDLAAHYDRIAFWLKLATPSLIILGVAAAMWPAPPVERAEEKQRRLRLNSVLAVLLAGGSIVTWVMTPDGQLTEHLVLSKEWLAVTQQVDKLRSDLHALAPTNEKVPAEMLAKIELFQGQESALYQGEIEPKVQDYYDTATIQARQQLYGVNVKTKEDAEKEYDRRKKLGTIPWRNTADRRQPLPKAPVAPRGHSVLPSTHNESSVATAR